MPSTRALKFDDGWRTDPLYAISLEACPKRVRAIFGNEVVADSIRVLTLLEQGHLPIYYFPKDDVRLDLLSGTGHSSHCPHKGDARYWTIRGMTMGMTTDFQASPLWPIIRRALCAKGEAS